MQQSMFENYIILSVITILIFCLACFIKLSLASPRIIVVKESKLFQPFSQGSDAYWKRRYPIQLCIFPTLGPKSWSEWCYTCTQPIQANVMWHPDQIESSLARRAFCISSDSLKADQGFAACPKGLAVKSRAKKKKKFFLRGKTWNTELSQSPNRIIEKKLA